MDLAPLFFAHSAQSCSTPNCNNCYAVGAISWLPASCQKPLREYPYCHNAQIICFDAPLRWGYYDSPSVGPAEHRPWITEHLGQRLTRVSATSLTLYPQFGEERRSHCDGSARVQHRGKRPQGGSMT